MYLQDPQFLEGPAVSTPDATQFSPAYEQANAPQVASPTPGNIIAEGFDGPGTPGVMTQGLGASPIVVTGQNTVIPFNPSLHPYDEPRNHCGVKQVLRLLRGLDLSPMTDSDGALTTFIQELREEYIPEATAIAVKSMRTNYDWSKEVWFFSGDGSPELVLPRREIVYVNAVFLRLLPNTLWYRFVRPRRLDGSEFAAIKGIEPPVPLPLDTSADPNFNQNIPYPQSVFYTGIEDADLFVDVQARTIKIPPRVLGATVQAPFFNYTFFAGVMNVEVHFAHGYQPSAYEDGTPLVQNLDGTLATLSPVDNISPVDWSSGFPSGLSMAVARLVYADVLRRLYRSISGGLSSMSVDGLSESYGSKAFGGGADEEEERAMKALHRYSILMV